jgi:hypothetical protein
VLRLSQHGEELRSHSADVRRSLRSVRFGVYSRARYGRVLPADVTHGRILSDGPVMSGGLSPANIAARHEVTLGHYN